MNLFTFFAVSFLIFWIISVIFGGDALNGKIENGHYYFGSHGKYTEVSRAAYVASAGYVMVSSAIGGFILLLIFLLLMRGGITIKDLKEGGISNIFLILPLAIGCGFIYLSFLALKCILHAFGIV